MDDAVVGIRFARHGPLVFCYTGDRALARGQHVWVALAGEVREGVVALAPAQIIAAPALRAEAPRSLRSLGPAPSAPALPDAPRVAAVAPVEAPDDAGAVVPPDVVFLPADGGGVGPADLARALELAARPVPAPPAERR